MGLSQTLTLLAERRTLSAEEMRRAVGCLVTPDADPVEAASFLTALRVRGETADELVGAVLALRDHAAKPNVQRKGLVDTCGTGGAPVATFNVSTAAAIVASACGVPVAKHGNRSFSAASGSADVLAALGVRLDAPRCVVEQCLDDIGLAFFFAPLWHPVMRYLAPVRKTLRFRTVFNLVGPLANPAPVSFQLVGVGQTAWADVVAKALQKLGVESAAVVVSQDGLDEVSLSAPTEVLWVQPDSLRSLVWTAEDFGLGRIDVGDVLAATAEQSADVVRRVLDAEEGPAMNLTLANAAAALWIARNVRSLSEGVEKARAAIRDGSAARRLEALVARTAEGREGES
jgi:anthranilate phosphoribosyltransferase